MFRQNLLLDAGLPSFASEHEVLATLVRNPILDELVDSLRHRTFATMVVLGRIDSEDPSGQVEGAAAHVSAINRGTRTAGLDFLRHGGLEAAFANPATLALPAAVLVLAFGALYYLEHFR